MTRAELVTRIHAAGLLYVPVRRGGDYESDRAVRYDGTPGEFLAAARELGARAVFVSSRVFAEANFGRPVRGSHYAYDGVPEDDLRTGEPALKQFEVWLGEEAAFSLAVRVVGVTLELDAEEPWWAEFTVLRDKAAATLDAAEAEAAASEYAASEKGRSAAKAGLAALLDNLDFQMLPTQAAMQAFAYDNVPGLDALDAKTVKAEVQTMHAKLVARGMGRRR